MLYAQSDDGPGGAANPNRFVRRLLWLYLAVVLISSSLLAGAVLIKGKGFVDAMTRTPAGGFVTLAQGTNSDSWMPLLETRKNIEQHPDAGLYALFTQGQWKFQYPPIALAIADAVPRDMADEATRNWFQSRLNTINNWFDRIAIAVTLLLSALVAVEARRQFGKAKPDRRADLGLMAAVIVLGFTFMPMLQGYILGQFQLACNALLALALLLFLRDRKLAAGIAIGLFCLIKPQLALVGLWALLRKEYRLAAGIAAIGMAGLAASAMLYGPHSLIDYLGVLRVLSERSEIFYYNQSLAGALLRFISPDQATFLLPMGSPLPAPNPAVHYASLIHSLALILLALVVARSAPDDRTDDRDSGVGRARIVDLCTIITVATVASPVAWNHHFGVLFPVLVVLIPLVSSLPRNRSKLRVLALCWLAIGAALTMPYAIYASRWSGLLGEQIFLGGQLLTGLLVVIAVQLRRKPGVAAGL